MATFDTTIGLGFETDLSPRANKRVTVMKDHSFVIQKDSSTILYIGFIFCLHLTATEKTTIETFYVDNEDIAWQFENPQDGEIYTLYFTGAPDFRREEREATVLHVCTLSVIGTKNP